MYNRRFLFLQALLCSGLILAAAASGCSSLPFPLRPRPSQTAFQLPATLAPSATPLPSATLAPTATPTATPAPAPNLWVAPHLPARLQENVQLPNNMQQTTQLINADLILDVGATNPVSTWVYALVAPFPTVPDGISTQQMQQAWAGESDSTSPLAGSRLLLDENTLQVLSLWWGKPAEQAVEVLPAADLLQRAWEQPYSWAIVPFEALDPRWKVLQMDGQSPLHKDFQPSNYALSVPISLSQTPRGSHAVFDTASLQVPATNWDANRLTTVVLTGVTALVRGTALAMEARGITYPAETIAPWLQQADILHISNEIPFYSQCPAAVLYPAELRFCSPPAYMELLQSIGADVIELTGDHFGDYGVAAMRETLALYDQNKLPYYGGGSTASQAKAPLRLEHNGNRIAFIGCNAKGFSFYAPASEQSPGAVQCDFEYMEQEISRLKQEGYLVIATFQHVEYYTYDPPKSLKDDFQRLAQAGAVIVSGSQAHQPHGMNFDNASFMHYGLGNLFFDQYRFFPGKELDRAFIDRHVFYEGRYIGTELLTIYFVDLARSRPTSAEERATFLQEIFTASGW